jgi:hypothetical protein
MKPTRCRALPDAGSGHSEGYRLVNVEHRVLTLGQGSDAGVEQGLDVKRDSWSRNTSTLGRGRVSRLGHQPIVARKV